MGFVEPHRNRHQTGGLQHLLARQIRSEVGEDRFASYFKFAVVRNPFDRLVSQYCHTRDRVDLRAFLRMPKDASFDEYLERIRARRHVQWEPQCSFLFDEDGTLLVDFVGRFERLAEDAAEIFARLGLDGAALPHANRSQRSPYRDYYRDDLRRQVEEMYGEDLARLDYEF